MVFQSSSSKATKEFAAKLAARALARGRGKSATIVTLAGELGAGKTTFVQGFYKGLGIKRVPNSPTFILMRRSALRGKAFKNVYHVDAYRIRAAKDMSVLGFEKFLANPENLFLIEWPERIAGILPKKTVALKFAHGKTPEERTIRVTGMK
jgi:tRNA threonylcarbamoyladenosine biosynthesis protein TsaE